ncbi:MAG: DUF134 domain-containing protein [Candidatus ainarchaeum sp.]|nr:DUF134 domain-containing protein [Candidatus ainarchaeum sp.]MDD5096463.1 DUF134 domain-containing protein [Candidatus ainarchaeum sp.]
MPRPLRCRRVLGEPSFSIFKPAGVPARGLTFSTLTVEEFEALRLADAEQMPQEKAASRMGVSQPTFSRILSSARNKVAIAISKGMGILIEGGTYKVSGRER